MQTQETVTSKQPHEIANAYFTEAEINENIVTEGYFTALDALSKGAFLKMPNVVLIETHGTEPDVQFSTGALAGLMICVLVLKNGFTVTGTSICMDHERFDAETARKQARVSAIAHLIPHLAYHVRNQRHTEYALATIPSSPVALNA